MNKASSTWIKDDADLLSYKKVYIAPVDTTHLLKLDWWQKTSLEPSDQQKWADELANYFRDKMKAQFTDDDPNKYEVVDVPDDEWAGHSRHTLTGWTDELKEICYRQPDEAVSGMSPVTLLPW